MVPGGQQSKRNGGEHEDNCAPGGDSGEQGGGAARTECGLAARAAEGGGNIRALAMLQQHNNDQDRAYKHMNRGEENNHVVVLEILSRIVVRKGGFEPPRLSAPPPQDGVSASSTTSAPPLMCLGLPANCQHLKPNAQETLIITNVIHRARHYREDGRGFLSCLGSTAGR